MVSMDTFLKAFTTSELVALDIIVGDHGVGDGLPSADVTPAFAAKRTRDGKARRSPVNKKDAPWQRMLDCNDANMNTMVRV
jgi:hypothetical protein